MFVILRAFTALPWSVVGSNHACQWAMLAAARRSHLLSQSPCNHCLLVLADAAHDGHAGIHEGAAAGAAHQPGIRAGCCRGWWYARVRDRDRDRHCCYVSPPTAWAQHQLPLGQPRTQRRRQQQHGAWGGRLPSPRHCGRPHGSGSWRGAAPPGAHQQWQPGWQQVRAGCRLEQAACWSARSGGRHVHGWYVR